VYRTDAAGICKVPTTVHLTTQPQSPGQPIATITDLYSTAPTQTSCPTTTWYSCM